MADHSGMADHQTPDYEIEDTLELDPEQIRVFFEPTRQSIIELLGERAATTSQLADALQKPKGTIGHHCKALEGAGLIRVVRTKRVRAIEAKYYGRTARTFALEKASEIDFEKAMFLTEAIREIDRYRQSNPTEDLPALTTIRYARIPQERAAEWVDRLIDLAAEFTKETRRGDRVYGVSLAFFPTTKPTLRDEDQP